MTLERTPDLDIETLRLLVAVSELGSLSAAARSLGFTQPAASARVRSFETRWQLGVVDRGPRGSQLTTDGLAVVAWARSVLHETDTMRSALGALGSERRDQARIAASLTVAEFLLPRWLGELRGRLPDVSPRLHVVNSADVSALVHDHTVDIGFIETAARPLDLDHRRVGSDRLIVVVAPAHPWARRSTAVTRSALQEAAWVMREPGSGTRSTFEGALRREPVVALEADSTTAVVGAARAGVGPAVVSERAVAGEIETGRLVAVRTDLDMLRPLTAVWRPDHRLSPAVTTLLSIAAAHAEHRS